MHLKWKHLNFLLDLYLGFRVSRRIENIEFILIRGKRDDVILATKVRWPAGPRPNERGLSRRHIIEACDLSLKRLQTDYIDLYQVSKHVSTIIFVQQTDWDLKAYDQDLRKDECKIVAIAQLHMDRWWSNGDWIFRGSWICLRRVNYKL